MDDILVLLHVGVLPLSDQVSEGLSMCHLLHLQTFLVSLPHDELLNSLCLEVLIYAHSLGSKYHSLGVQHVLLDYVG